MCLVSASDSQDAFVELIKNRDKLNERLRQQKYRLKNPGKVHSERRKIKKAPDDECLLLRLTRLALGSRDILQHRPEGFWSHPQLLIWTNKPLSWRGVGDEPYRAVLSYTAGPGFLGVLSFRGPDGPGRAGDFVKEIGGEAPHLFDKVPGPTGAARASEKQPPKQARPGRIKQTSR